MLAWGNFVTIVINFIIIAFALFGVVNLIPADEGRRKPPAPAAPPRQEVLLEDIRDLLAKK